MKKPSLKGFDAKAFLLNHAEKLGFGLIVLIALLALSRTQWARYEGTPEEIQADIKKNKDRILGTQWPADKQNSFVLEDFMDRANQLKAPLSVARYEYSTNMWWPLYRKQELAKEPELLAVLDLDAIAGTFILGVSDNAPAGELAAADGSLPTDPALAAAQPEVDESNEFNFQAADPKAPTASGRGVPGGFPGMPGGMSGAGGSSGGEDYTPPEAMMPGMAGGGSIPGLMDRGNTEDMYSGASSMPGMPGMMPGMRGGGAATAKLPSFPGIKPRGERFVAVRGVWQYRQQLEKFQRALNLQTTNDASLLLELLDFELERQTATKGEDPWSGPWEVVDITRAKEVLDEAADYDVDTLDPEILHHVITSPLPKRLPRGVWGEAATHPQIKRFELSPAEAAKQQRLEAKLQEEFEKYRLKEDSKSKAAPQGFAGKQRNYRGMAQALMNSEHGSTAGKDMMRAMRQPGMPAGGAPLDPAKLKQELTAVGYLLLFRYFDFDVRPGYAYRYRVKLKLRNPNFEKPLEQVADASYTRNPELLTPVSNVSNAAIVPESVNYFVKDVERDPVFEAQRSASKALANVSFYEWNSENGTYLMDTVKLTTFGQRIGERKESLLLDVATPSFKKEQVTFDSDDLLADSMADIKLNVLEEHKELKLAPEKKGRVAPPELLVLDRAGQLKTTEFAGLTPKETFLKRRVDLERTAYKEIEGEDPKAATSFDVAGSMEGDMYSEGGMPGMGAMSGRKPGSKKNSRKPMGGSSGGSGGSDMMEMMMRGGPMGGMSGGSGSSGANPKSGKKKK